MDLTLELAFPEAGRVHGRLESPGLMLPGGSLPHAVPVKFSEAVRQELGRT